MNIHDMKKQTINLINNNSDKFIHFLKLCIKDCEVTKTFKTGNEDTIENNDRFEIRFNIPYFYGKKEIRSGIIKLHNGEIRIICYENYGFFNSSNKIVECSLLTFLKKMCNIKNVEQFYEQKLFEFI